MRKVFLLVGCAIAVYLAFTAFSVHMAAHERNQLAAIRDVYFPVLQHADADLIRIDKMEGQYLQAVELGEPESVDKARVIGAEAQADLAEIGRIYRERAPDIMALRRQLDRYQELAERNAAAMLAHSALDERSVLYMNRSLTQLRSNLRAFRESSFRSFTDTLAETQGEAESGSVMGLALGAMNLCFMGVLVYFIRNNMRMMTVIAEQNSTLELRVAERTAELSRKNADINAMLQNMKLGVATVVPGNRIHPEYSAYLRTIVDEADLAGRGVLEAVFGHSDLGIDSKDQLSAALAAILGEDAMMFEFNGHLLPRETLIGTPSGGERIVQLEWNPIINESGIVEKMLLIAQDVTHLRDLESRTAKQKQELDIISKILKVSAGKFNEFTAAARRFTEENRRLIADTTKPDAETVAALFRNMHTVKGSARSFDFTQITDAAHIAEQAYDRLRSGGTAGWQPLTLLGDLAAVEDAVARYVAVNEDTLGRNGRAADMLTDRGAFVDNQALSSLKAIAAALPAAERSENVRRLQQAIDGLGFIAMSRLLSGAADTLASLAKGLGKPPPVVRIQGPDLALTTKFAEILKICAMHVFSNAMDHGIETPEERAAASKPAQGTLLIETVRHAEAAEIRFCDDGRGLALHAILAKAVAEGLLAPGGHHLPEAVADLIFRPGMTTAPRLTELSGRGVGLDVVRTFLREQGATIRVELHPDPAAVGPGAAVSVAGRFFMPFSFVVGVPRDCFHSIESQPSRA